jgi:hypothetical protein
MKLYRSKDGRKYHTEDCRWAGNAAEWIWARDKTEYEVWETWEHGVYACMTCKPLGAKSGLVQP